MGHFWVFVAQVLSEMEESLRPKCLLHIRLSAITPCRQRKEMKNLNVSFFYCIFLKFLFKRDALKTSLYEICFKIDPRIFEIFGSKVLKRGSA